MPLMSRRDLTRSVLLPLSLALFSMLLLITSAHARYSENPKLGINVGDLGKLTSSIPFTDIFKISRGWFTSCEYDWQANRPIDPGCSRKSSLNTREQDQLQLDGNGWVRSLPLPYESPVFTSVTSTWKLSKHFPTGRYVVLYDGEGKIKMTGDLRIAMQRPGHLEFDLLSPKRNLKLQITSTDPRRNGNYIRNIRIVPKKNEHNYRRTVFNPDYLARIRPMQALRFMPWTNPRANEAVEWNQRAGIGAAHYTGDKGVPAERMIDLANAINATPFVSIPYKASDDYMRQYARMVKNRLRRNQKVYVEYSNEVWNTIFPAATYAARKADTLWHFPYKKEAPGKRRVLLASNWYAKRSVEMCRIWKQEFGGQRNRVRCMLGTLNSVPWVGQEIVDCPLWKEARGCGRHVDAFGIGPYFGDYIARKENRQTVKSWTRDSDGGRSRLFQEILHGGMINNGPAGGAMARLQTQLVANKKIADKYRLELVAYEGGQHLIRYDPPHTVKDPAVLNLFMSVQEDPRMRTAYQRYLQTWAQNGGGLMLHFYGIGEPEPKNFFGMLDYLSQPSTPKYAALMDYLGTRTSYVPPRKQYVPPSAPAPVVRKMPPPARSVAVVKAPAPAAQPTPRTKTLSRKYSDSDVDDDEWDTFLGGVVPKKAPRNMQQTAQQAVRQRAQQKAQQKPPVRPQPQPRIQPQKQRQPERQPVHSSPDSAITGPAIRGWTVRGNMATSPPIALKRGVNHNLNIIWNFKNIGNTGRERFRIYAIDHKGGRKVLLEQTARDILQVRDFDQIFEDNINHYIGPPIRLMFEVTGGLQAVISDIRY